MMNNTMKIDGHIAVVTYDPEIEMFRGKFLHLNGGADFYADSVEKLKEEGKTSLRVFLEVCEEKGIAPVKTFSGKVTTRLAPPQHAALALAAQATGRSINDLLSEGADLVLMKYEYSALIAL